MKRTVRLKVTFEMDYEVPEDWDDDMILFHVNESSSCSDNLLAQRLEQTQGPDGFCTCMVCEAELIRPGESESDFSAR